MQKRPKKKQETQARLQDLVVVTFADDMTQAKDREALLRNNDIPATIREQEDETTGTNAIVVMVPEEFIDEAHVIIESQDAYDDFYDFALDDEENGEFDSDFYDDEL